MKRPLSVLAIVVGVYIMLKLFAFATSSFNDKQFQSELKDGYKIFALNIPENLNFAGEKVPVNDFDVRESLDRELILNTYFQSQTLLLFKRANRWFPLIEAILKKNNIPDDFKYISLVESNLTNTVSPAGATGFWQIIESTGKIYGLEISPEVDERYNVEKSTEAACKYFKEAYNTLGSWTLVAGSYNMGISGIQKQLKSQKVNSYYDLLLNQETARYVFRILAMKEIISNPANYGYHIRKKDLYPKIPTYDIALDTIVDDWAEWAIKHETNYKILKIFNPWLRKPILTNKEKKKYIISLPKKGFTDLGFLLKSSEFQLNDTSLIGDTLLN